eukprot:2780336-Pyramimonas_sp.AAC.1
MSHSWVLRRISLPRTKLLSLPYRYYIVYIRYHIVTLPTSERVGRHRRGRRGGLFDGRLLWSDVVVDVVVAMPTLDGRQMRCGGGVYIALRHPVVVESRPSALLGAARIGGLMGDVNHLLRTLTRTAPHGWPFVLY